MLLGMDLGKIVFLEGKNHPPNIASSTLWMRDVGYPQGVVIAVLWDVLFCGMRRVLRGSLLAWGAEENKQKDVITVEKPPGRDSSLSHDWCGSAGKKPQGESKH